MLVRARQPHHAFFERLPQHLEHVAAKLRQLVEKEHAAVSERDLSGARDGPSPDDRGVRCGVMWCAKWWGEHCSALQ